MVIFPPHNNACLMCVMNFICSALCSISEYRKMPLEKPKSKMTEQSKSFTSFTELCPACGTILPLPGAEPYVQCRKCPYKIDACGRDSAKFCFVYSI